MLSEPVAEPALSPSSLCRCRCQGSMWGLRTVRWRVRRRDAPLKGRRGATCRPRNPVPQPLAAVGHMPHRLIRIIHKRQRVPRMAMLPTRLAAAPAAQGLRRGFGRAVRRRRLMGVLRVHAQPGFQLDDPGLQLGDQRIPLGELPQQLLHQRDINHGGNDRSGQSQSQADTPNKRPDQLLITLRRIRRVRPRAGFQS